MLYPKKSAAARARGARLRTAALAKYLADPVKCQYCGNDILPKEGTAPGCVRRRKYCGHSCAASATNGVAPKRAPEGTCDHCGHPCVTSHKYCSVICKSAASYARKKTLAAANGQRVVEWRQRIKIKAVALLGGQCVLCGYSKYVGALHFHHRNPDEKDFTLSRGIRSWQQVQEELKKCVLLCGNCHAEVHAGVAVLPVQLSVAA